MISRDRDHSEGWGVGVNCRLKPFQKFIRAISLIFLNTIFEEEKHTLNPDITDSYQFHAQKALFKFPKICNIRFWIENDPPLLPFSENSSDLVAGPFSKQLISNSIATAL